MRFLFLTMDGNHDAALRNAVQMVEREYKVRIDMACYNGAMLQGDEAWRRLAADIAQADFIFGSMLFKEELVRPLQKLLSDAPAPTCIITSNPALIRCTRLGKFVLHPKAEEEAPSVLKEWIKKLRPKGGENESHRQLAMVRNLSKVLRLIPGKARDLHTYIVAHDYWLQSSPENLKRMLCLFVERYVPGYAGKLPIQDPLTYAAMALYHPDAPTHFDDLAAYTQWRRESGTQAKLDQGSVGILAMRTVVLSGNTGHIDALIRALEARGIEARAAYCSGLDSRPAVTQYFAGVNATVGAPTHEGKRGGFFGLGQKLGLTRQESAPAVEARGSVDMLVNASGFSLVGGPAESHPERARATLEGLDVGYMGIVPLSFQHVDEWQRDDSGLMPIQVSLNLAIPELDGAVEPWVYGGPAGGSDRFVPIAAQVETTANRIAKRVTLHRRANAAKKIAIVLFNFPPNLGNVGTAAYLDVFCSVHRLLTEMRGAGYQVDVPADPETLRREVAEGNALMFGTDGNVGARLPLDAYRRLFPAHREIEKFWGAAPGELLNDGKGFYILGKQYGNVYIGLQPSFGYERDPMRLLMAKDAAPHHGFAAFYTWLEHTFGADAVLHFGTHGALEFMPGKQAGMSTQCWPTRLIGSLPNFYYYSVNNPSEATIAKRRGAATLVSYLVPPLQQAGLYKGLRVLKDSLESYRRRATPDLLEDIRIQAGRLDITVDVTPTEGDEQAADEAYIAALSHELIQIEHRMIPLGLHVLGQPPVETELLDTLTLITNFHRPKHPSRQEQLAALPELVAGGLGWDYAQLRAATKHDLEAQERAARLDQICREAVRRLMTSTPAEGDSQLDAYLQQTAHLQPGLLADLWRHLREIQTKLVEEHELKGLMNALAGGFIPPSPGNDVVRNAAVVPTGRNIHALDPFRVPTPAAHVAGAKLTREMLDKLTVDQGQIPETISIVLWGTDNLKSDCEGVAQVFALLGCRAVHDELGMVADVELLPLRELGRPRIDVVVTVSGIFRDLLQHQMVLLDKAVHLAARAEEPEAFNFVRKHAQAQAATMQVSLDEAATRIFTNAPGSYGASVNHLVESSNWDSDDQLSEAFLSRKCFAYGSNGVWRDARGIMEKALATVNATFQNIDSFEIGISDVDHYYEYLGGATKSVEKLSGKRPPVLVADAFSLNGRISTLEQMVRLESRAKLLNPKWYDAMLAHGYEGVREIETRVSNTYGWSATADGVESWVYQNIAETFVLDEEMRHRLAHANPHATAAIARRLLEADDRGFWDATAETIAKLREIYGDLEDRLEGIAA